MRIATLAALVAVLALCMTASPVHAGTGAVIFHQGARARKLAKAVSKSIHKELGRRPRIDSKPVQLLRIGDLVRRVRDAGASVGVHLQGQPGGAVLVTMVDESGQVLYERSVSSKAHVVRAARAAGRALLAYRRATRSRAVAFSEP